MKPLTPGHRLIALITLHVLASLALAGPTTQPTSRPASAYPYETIERRNPELRAYVVKIDLTDPNVSLHLASGGDDPDGDGPWETVLKPTSQIARENDFDIAINTAFFMRPDERPGGHKLYQAGEWAASAHLLMRDGKLLTGRRGGAGLVIDRTGERFIQTFRAIPVGARLVVSGNTQVVFRGKIAVDKGGERAPRTAIGLADEGKTLIILVADGRRKGWSMGLTMHELAGEMIKLGATDAVNLDGGGSSTLVMKTPAGEPKVINVPSDGATAPIPLSIERPVAYVLGIKFASPAP